MVYSPAQDIHIDCGANKTLVLDQPVWDDLRVAASTAKLIGSGVPDWEDFIGTSTKILSFDATSEEEIYFTIQLPHRYKEGTDVCPHVHWCPASNGTGTQKVSWGLEYTWSNIGSVFGSTTTIYGNTSYPDETLVANKHYLTDFTDIDGTGQTISSMLSCRLFRDATGAGATDDYADDAGLLEFDLHYQIDTQGSREEASK